MSEKPSFDELKSRIESDIAHYQGKLPERVALVWHGYLVALLEWGLISVSDHAQLVKLLPPVDDNPVVAIMLGRDNES